MTDKIPARFLLGGILLVLFMAFLPNATAQINLQSNLTGEQKEAVPALSSGVPVGEAAGDDLSMEVILRGGRREEPSYDIPIVINGRVEQFIHFFQTSIRHKFITWLSRSEKYIPFMKGVLREHGLPEDLVYLSLIESGFDPHAYSKAKAVGLWQFIYLTGKRYGLRSNWWVDERRDPEKSTVAAAKYLKDLYDMFACWYLAAAGYNAGEYKIINAIKRYKTEDFWKLANYRYLKRETKDYVPLMIAATLVAKEPEKYGFMEVEYQEPLRYEKVKVPGLTDLSHIAKACETSLEEIKDLNPELRRAVTPPDETDYEIKIPFGKRDLFLENFEGMKPLEKFPFREHLVKKGESLPGIAKSYRVDLEPLLEINQLSKTSPLSKGMTLLIPLSKDEVIPVLVAQKKNGKVRNTKPTKRL